MGRSLSIACAPFSGGIVVARGTTTVYKPAQEDTVLEVADLTKNYGSRRAVDAISFRVRKGEIVGFLGPNGAGKSTTLRMITGFLAPSAGRIRVGEVDAVRDPIGARRQIGYMPEGVPLYPEMRVHEYLRYRGELKGIRGRGAIDAALERSLRSAQVEDVRDRIIGQLSKGYRQRVGLADALLADPPLLILDEPTSGLDPNQIRAIRALVRGFAGDKTILLSTHILPEVEALCGRVLIVHKGRLVGEGAPGELRGGRGGVRLLGRGELDSYRAVLEPFDASVKLRREGELVAAELHLEADDAVEEVFRAVAKAGLVLRELRPFKTSLEDVFAALTTDESERSGQSSGEEE